MLDHFSVYEYRNVYFDLNMRTNFHASDECDCMDAIDIIPAGSTVKQIGCRDDIFETSSRIYRGYLK